MHIRFAGGAFEFHYTPPKTRKLPPITRMVRVTLQELYTGVNRSISYTRHVVCPHCNGSGARREEERQPCSVCGGKGHHLFLWEEKMLLEDV